MKWVKKDIYGNEQVWYSEDVIEQIYEIAKNYCKQKIHDTDIDKILEVIENENTED